MEATTSITGVLRKASVLGFLASAIADDRIRRAEALKSDLLREWILNF